MVRNLCDRAMVLDHGDLLHVGDVNEAIATYRHSLDPQGEVEQPPADGAALDPGEAGTPSPVNITETWIEPPANGQAAHRPGDQVVVGMRFAAPDDELVRARLQIHSHDGVHIVNISGWDISGLDVGPTATTNEVRFVIEDLPLTDGHYLVTLTLQDPNETVEHDRQEQELAFDVFSGGPVLGRVVMRFRIETMVGEPAPGPGVLSG